MKGHGVSVREAVLLMLVALVSWAEAARYLAGTSARSEYLLNYYAPAIAVAAGQGFHEIDLSAAPAIRDFLTLKREALTAADLAAPLPLKDTTPFQKIHRTSMTMLGWWWHCFGVQWHALDALLALMFAVSCVFAYGVLRLCSPWPVALALGMAVVYSPGFHYALPQFRDFSKAPFVLGIILGCVLLIRIKMRPSFVVMVALALGAWVGLGLGFRQDLRVYLPLAGAAIWLSAAGGFRQAWRSRVAACLVLVLGFGIAASPVLPALRGATNSTHIISLGLGEPFNRLMGLGGAPYAFANRYDDFYMHTRIAGYAAQREGGKPPAYWTPQNDAAGGRLLSEFYQAFPADNLLRWCASAWTILNYAPFNIERFYPTNGDLFRLLDARYAWLGFLDGRGAVLAAVVCCVLAGGELRLGLAAFLMLFFLCGYPSLQFNARHYFMLELGALWAFATAIGLAWGGITRYRNGSFVALGDRTGVLRGVLFGATVAGGLAGAYAVALGVQHARVGAMLDAYAKAAHTPLALAAVPGKPDEIAVSGAFPAVSPDEKFRVREAVLGIQYTAGPEPFRVEPRYSTENKSKRVVQRIGVAGTAAPGDRWLYVPVEETDALYFGRAALRFTGFGAPQAVGRVKGVYRLETNRDFPLALVLSDDPDAPRGMRWEGENVPAELRGERAFGRNLLENGSFERWDAAGGIPVGMAMPADAHCELHREAAAVANGAAALRETWTVLPPNAGAGPALPVTIPADARCIEVYARCWNQSGQEIRLRVTRAAPGGVGAGAAIELPGGTLRFEPSTDYVEKRLRVTVPPESPRNLWIQLLGNPAFQGGETALWDALRVVPCAPPQAQVPLVFE